MKKLQMKHNKLRCTLTMSPEVVRIMDVARGVFSRSSFVEHILRIGLEIKEPEIDPSISPASYEKKFGCVIL